MLSLWRVDNQVAQRREQLLQIKAAKDTKAAHAMANESGSVGEEEEAVAIAPLAVARGAREVAAGSAVAMEAEQCCRVRRRTCK